MAPGVGEAMDVQTMFAAESAWWERGLSGVSLAGNVLTLGFAPNFGAISKARRATGSTSVATRGAIGATGKVGEHALKALGGEPQAFFRTSQGGRYIDQLVNGIAHESKVGYTTLTKDVSRQIAKDVELIAGRDIQGSVWHFFRSPVTGVGGPSGPLRQALENAGIGVVIH